MLDYCPALCETAKKRVNSRGWGSFVSVVLGDASDFECKGLPAAGTVDVVTFSYALSMIPDWKAAVRNAFRMLKKGGHIAVCDFTVLDAQWAGMSDLWTWIFSNDHVHLRYTLRRHTRRALARRASPLPHAHTPALFAHVGKSTSRRCAWRSRRNPSRRGLGPSRTSRHA